MAHAIGITLRTDSDDPIYQQIVDQIVGRIQSGALAPGVRLPPTRALADELGTTRNTVVRAFEQLTLTGWLEATVGRGTFVRRPDAVPEVAPTSIGLPWGRLFSRSASSEHLGRAELLAAGWAERPSIDLQRLQPPNELLPVDEIRRCMDHALRSRGPRALAYAPAEGVLALREQLAADLSRRGIPCRPDDLVVTSGSQQALDLVVRALVDPGDVVLVDRYTYAGALRILGAAGAQVTPVPGDPDGPDVATLYRQRGAKALYAMPDGQNPTGAWIGAERRHQLVEWSRKAGVPLIEDDYTAGLDLDDVPMPPALRALDGEVIYISTVSKKLVPSLRLGVVVCPLALRSSLLALKRATDLCCSAMLQYALAEFLERGYLRAHLARVVPEYRRRRDALVEALARYLPAGLRVDVGRRGVSVWVALPVGVDPMAVFAEAHRRGVAITPGTLNAVFASEANGIRLTFCGEPPDRLVEGARRLGEAVSTVLAGTHDATLEGP